MGVGRLGEFSVRGVSHYCHVMTLSTSRSLESLD